MDSGRLSALADLETPGVHRVRRLHLVRDCFRARRQCFDKSRRTLRNAPLGGCRCTFMTNLRNRRCEDIPQRRGSVFRRRTNCACTVTVTRYATLKTEADRPYCFQTTEPLSKLP